MPSTMTKRQETTHQVKLAHKVHGRKPIRRIPKVNPPRGIERAYALALSRFAQQLPSAYADLLRAMPDLIASAKYERHDAQRWDISTAERLKQLLAAAQTKLASALDERSIERLATQYAARTVDYQKSELSRQTKAALGADVFVADRGLKALTAGFVAENVQLIKSIPEQLHAQVAAASLRALQNATPNKRFAQEIEDTFGVAKRRARLIARDQIGKLMGQVAAQRQRALGVTHYIWRTVNDDRVRDEHKDREGKTYAYEGKDAADELPGEAIQCRCFAEPIFDGILDE